MGRTIGRAGVASLVAGVALVAFAAPALAAHSQWIGGGDSVNPFANPVNRYEVSEADGSITLQFTPGFDPTHETEWRTESRSATGGSDFLASSGRWPSVDGDQSPSVTIEVIDDDRSEGTEDFGVLLWLEGYPPRPADGASCVTHEWCDYAIVTIRDDDGPLPGTEPAPDPAEATDGLASAVEPSDGEDALAGGAPAATPSLPVNRAQPPPAEAPTVQEELAPGSGFELVGAQVRNGQAAPSREGASRGGPGVAPWVAVAALGVAVPGLGMWAWRRRTC